MSITHVIIKTHQPCNPNYNTVLRFTNGSVSQVNGGVRSRERRGYVSVVNIYHKSIGYSFVCYGKVLNWHFWECILRCKGDYGVAVLQGVGTWQCCVPPKSVKYLHLPLLKNKKCLKTMFETFIPHHQSCAHLLYPK